MSLPAGELEDIHAAFADPIVYVGAGLAPGADPITGIFSDIAAGEFMGAGATARRVSFEIRMGDLPGKPAKGDRITHKGLVWSVIDRTAHSDISRWVVVVEKAT